MGDPSPQPRPKLRASLTGFPERYALPSRPLAAAAAQDAHRQTGFLLTDDLALFERAMNLQLQIVSANAKARTPEAAALFGFWSRTFSHLSDACALMCVGSYVSCPPLLRTACDCIAAQRSLIEDGFEEYLDWYPEAISREREFAALAIGLGRFRAGSVLASDARLGTAYRLLTDLSMPHFGTSVLQTAPETNLQKMPITFAGSAFHLGWAELILGWLVMLAGAQLETAAGSRVFAVDEATHMAEEALARDIETALTSTRRCYVEDIDGLFVLRNFRRTAGGAPKRVVLG